MRRQTIAGQISQRAAFSENKQTRTLGHTPQSLLAMVFAIIMLAGGLFTAAFTTVDLTKANAQSTPADDIAGSEPIQIHKVADVERAELGQTVTYRKMPHQQLRK